MKRKIIFEAMAVCLLVLGLTLIGCGGGGKANPATDFSYELTADGQGILIKRYTGGPGRVVIPSTIEDIPVVEIGDDTFNGKSMTFSVDINSGSSSIGAKNNKKAGITEIIIPDTVKKIGRSAFANTVISSIVIPDSVTELAFSNIMGSLLFTGCKQLAEIKFSDNIEFLPGLLGGFGGLPALKKVNLPKNLKWIEIGCFSGCGELTEIVIPDEITELKFIDYNMYARPQNIIIPDDDNEGGFVLVEDATKIRAFEYCSKLPLKTRQKLQELGYTGTF
jgi:hypothetical protein